MTLPKFDVQTTFTIIHTIQPTANMKPLSLSDKNKLVAAYSQVLRAITALLTRAGAFLTSLGIDGHIVSRGIVSLADALIEFQGVAVMIEDWVEHMINSQASAAFSHYRGHRN